MKHLADATETEFIGLTLPKAWLKQIDQKIENNPMIKRQDWIRSAIQKQLNQEN